MFACSHISCTRSMPLLQRAVAPKVIRDIDFWLFSSLPFLCSDRYKIIRRLCAIGGFLLFARYFLHWVPRMDTMDHVRHPSTEWMRGNQLCTFKTRGMAHLGWSIPMADPSYYVMGASIHAFLMFAPFVALYEQKGLVLQGLVLLLTGPVLSSYLSSNNMEKGNIWGCLSIVQVRVCSIPRL